MPQITMSFANQVGQELGEPARLRSSCSSLVREVIRDIVRQTGSYLRRPGIVDRFQKWRHESIPRRLCLACTSSPVYRDRTLVRPVTLSKLSANRLRADRAVKPPDVGVSSGLRDLHKPTALREPCEQAVCAIQLRRLQHFSSAIAAPNKSPRRTSMLTAFGSARTNGLTLELCGPASRFSFLLRASVRHTDACHSQGRKEPTRSTPKLAHVREPRTTVVNPA